MIKELSINNFRSIREALLQLGRFTVLNGANNSGKSSVLYALQVLKNVVTNPNRSVEELLNLGFLNIGNLEKILFNDRTNKDPYLTDLEIFIRSETKIKGHEKIESKYGVTLSFLGDSLKIIGINPIKFRGVLPVSFPYGLNSATQIIIDKNKDANFSWNGYQASEFKQASTDNGNPFGGIRDQVERPISDIFSLDLISTFRGFSKNHYNIVPLAGQIVSENEIATLLAIDKNLQPTVSYYFEKITGKRFSVSIGPGGGFFYLQVRESDTPFTTELVNQGMGINQILFLLAKILYDKNRLICIDEPEIHLHPSLIERFVKVLVEIAKKEDKQFIFSTHSEHWLLSMLAEVNDGNLKAEDLKVYYLYKDNQETKIESQTVQSNGQIEGGLRNFLDAEMHLTQRFLD